jgi:hypothetical protein
MTHQGAAASPESERLRELLLSSTSLTEEAVALARALGAEASGTIIAEVIDAPPAPDTLGSAIRAAHLACELGLVAAVDPLARYVERLVRFPVGETVLSALARLGTAGAAALLGMHERCDAEDRGRIVEALARSEARDERIRRLLLRILDEDPARGARLLARRGDWRAVPDLLRAFDTLARRPVADCDLCAADDLSAIGSAVLALGGRLSRDRSSRIDEAFERSEPMWTALEDDWMDRHLPRGIPVVRGPRPGRNDPCPCGSGKKHKRCCLDTERGGRRH